MNARQLKSIKVGDRITFKACTRSHFREATRIVQEINWCDRPGYTCVKYHGWSNFVVKPREILEIHPEVMA